MTKIEHFSGKFFTDIYYQVCYYFHDIISVNLNQNVFEAILTAYNKLLSYYKIDHK